MSVTLATLPSEELLARVRDLIRRGNEGEADLLANLGEVDARRLYLQDGCPSAHNQLRARIDFGEQHMGRFERRAGSESSSP